MTVLAWLLSGKAWVCKTHIRGFDSRPGLRNVSVCKKFAKVVILGERPGGGTVYAGDLKSLTRKSLWVRIPPRAHKQRRPASAGLLCLFSWKGFGRRRRIFQQKNSPRRCPERVRIPPRCSKNQKGPSLGLFADSNGMLIGPANLL